MTMITDPRSLVTYDHLTGSLTRNADGKDISLRRTVRLNDKYYTIHRLMWFCYYGEWPPPNLLIDHADRNRHNNKITNLRLATHSQNGFNSLYPNPHAVKGITYDRERQKWRAQIRIGGLKTNLGRFQTKEEAVEAYRQAALEHHGEFVCLNPLKTR